MTALAQHIACLLLEHDCVIIPGLGGFILHYSPATRNGNVFLPPTRTIGFNPSLVVNDGVLAQSYMRTHRVDFSHAVRMITQDVDNLIACLHEKGKVELGTIGELRCNVNGQYEFTAYDDKLIRGPLYGLERFSFQPLMEKRESAKVQDKESNTIEIHIHRSVLRYTVAMVAAVLLLFVFSTPTNKDSLNDICDYAQLVPRDLVSTVSEPLAIQDEDLSYVTQQGEPIADVSSVPVAESSSVPEVKELRQPTGQLYHIIVAGGISLRNAHVMAEELVTEGYETATVLDYDDKIRVSLYAFSNSAEAYTQLGIVRQNERFVNAWVLCP